MTREEAEVKINHMYSVDWCLIADDGAIDLTIDNATASDLRAIADILDQVGKEDGKAGGDFQNGNNHERGEA